MIGLFVAVALVGGATLLAYELSRFSVEDDFDHRERD